MKKIISFLLVASMMLISVNSFAQLHIGAGYINSADRYKTNSDADVNATYLNGFYAGGGFSIPIVAGLQVTPGVYYVFTAKNDADGLGGLKLTGDTKEHYINVPVDISYGYEISPDFRVFAFAGPTASVGLASKTKLTATYKAFAVDDEIDNYDEDYDYARFDVLLGGGVGVDVLKRVRVTARYDCGLVNRYNGDGDPIRHRNQFTAGVAYLF